jgi:esterase/lipase superfamily enzyme
VPDGDQPLPAQQTDAKAWAKKVLAESRRGVPKAQFGNILIFVHGYNNSQETVMKRHRRLRDDLKAEGFPGVVTSFDWPSADSALGYVPDRIAAKRTAMQLVTDGIATLAALQEPDCRSNVHILAHSMGSYVVREAFDDADDRALSNQGWLVSQVMLIGADVSAGSLGLRNSSADSLYRHCTRLTNYSNRHDGVLALSNVKRAGVAPRAGRVGLPAEVPDKAVNIDCSDYWEKRENAGSEIGDPRHSWHIGNRTFNLDMIKTMLGIDREKIETREKRNDQLYLKQRP